ncbi:conjugal transfer protein TraG [Escherichia coli]|nr:conjugal transfer protein TraG [Escherichia coli]
MLNTVELMSSSQVFAEYNNMIHGPLSPLYKLKKSYKILVRVQSITFLDEKHGTGTFC